MKYQAVIFDMDGVLMDSEGVITKAAQMCLAEHGVHAEEHEFDPFRGTGEDKFIQGVAEKHGLTYHTSMKQRTFEIFFSIVDREIKRFPGIPELLRAVRSLGLKTAVGSSADGVKVHANLRACGIDEALFDAMAVGDEVTHKKPSPDLFLLAASRLGIAPEHCLVIEDALVGLTAARAAGMGYVAVKGTFPDDQLRASGALALFDSTAELETWLKSSASR